MDSHAVLLFAAATFFETVNPGPTLAFVLTTLAVSNSHRIAFWSVAGIAVANALWAFVVFGINQPQLADTIFVWILQLFSAGFLVYMASQRIISVCVEWISKSAARQSAPSSRKVVEISAIAAFFGGLGVHALNPLTPPYYIGPFFAATSGTTEGTLICGLIAVFFDAVFYSLVVLTYLKLGWLSRHERLARFVAGLFFLFLVARVFSASTPTQGIAVSAATTIAMLFGFLTAVVQEVLDSVRTRKGKENRVLWRMVGMWAALFSIITIVGGILTLYQALGAPPSPANLMAQQLRICFIVSAIIATALAFAKSLGELQDEKPVDGEKGGAADATSWQANPYWSGGVVMLFLAALFACLAITGFSVK